MRQVGLLWGALALMVVPTLRAQSTPSSLVAAVQAYVEKQGDHQEPRFDHALFDLDGDGRKDAIVLLTGSLWCGSGGCTMLVFRGTPDRFAFISRSTITREPIRVSTETVGGWKTLIVSARGVGDVLMPFDGTGYPLNPSKQPKATSAQVNAATVVLK
jgi:hypothetical protein